MPRMPRVLVVSLATCLAAACSTKVPRNNQYDPEGTGPKAPGRITGTVYVQGQSDQSGTAIRIFDAQGARVDGGQLFTGDGGVFLSADLNPGAFRVEAEVPIGNVPIRRDGVQVIPGQTADVGLLTSLTEPPIGRIEGLVEMSESSISPADVRVIATRLTGAVSESRVGYTNAAGEYVFTELPPGDYEVRADRSGFTPDLTSASVASPSRSVTRASTMRLYPASAVARFEVQTSDGTVIGAPYTSSPNVDLLLLAFGGANEVRLSESSSFMENGAEVPWRQYVAHVPWVLSAGEGTKTVYSQFRVVEPDSGRERLRTETYTSVIVLDETPPVIVSYELAPDAIESGGERYLTGDPTSVPVRVLALDPHSKVSGVRFLVEGADPALVPYNDVSASDGSVTIFDLVALSPSDGAKVVGVQLRDGAGNESDIVESEVTIDTTPPALLGNPAVVVRGADGAQLTTTLVTLQLLAGADAANDIDGPVRMRYGLAPAPPSGATGPFLPEVSLAFSAQHGDSVQFFAAFQDNAGNEVVAPSPIYTMNLRGTIAGKVYVEGVAEGPTGHDGTQVEVFAADADLSADPAPVAIDSGATQPNGAYSVPNLPPGTYLVRFSRFGYISLVRAPVIVTAGATTQLGTERLTPARGDLQGTFLYGDLGPGDNHGGITVSAVLAGRVVSSAVTDASGVVTLTGLPVADTYEIRASADGYITATLTGESVVQDTLTAVHAGSPLSLAKLSGDFKICDHADAAAPPKNCAPILYTREAQVLLGLDADNVTHVRYALQDPASPGLASFLNPLPPPDAGADVCTSGPAEQCWNSFDAAERYFVDVSAVEGRATVLVQFANNDNMQQVSSSVVIYDVQVPQSPAISIARGAQALVDGYTNDTELALTLTAVATTGPSDSAAPLATVRVSRDDVWDGAGTNGDREYSYGGTKLFTVAAGDGTKDVYAWFCDAARNCNATPVTDSVILDTTPPSRTNGRDISPSGLGVTAKSLADREWWTRSTRYSVTLALGTSPYGIAEVAAYRTALSEEFVGATWTTLDLGTLGAGSTVVATGIELPPVDGDHVVWSQFKDAAGNVSTELTADKLTLALDSVPPGGTVSIEGGARFTRETTLDVALTTDAVGGATAVQYSWTGILPDPNDAASRVAYASPLSLPLTDTSDGTKQLHVRFFDPAGNFAERTDDIFLDRTPPDAASAIASCDTCTYDSSGNAYFRDTNGQVTLYLFAVDNSGFIDHVEVVVDGDTANPRIIQYAPYQTITVSTVPGPHTLEVAFVDPAGNSTVMDVLELELDRQAPSVSLSINAAAEWTNDPRVALGLTATDASELMGLYVSNSSTFSAASLIPFTTSLEWTVGSPTADDDKLVYVRVVDAAGNVGEASDAIKLDATPPTLAPSLSGPAAGGTSSSITRSSTVTVSLGAADAGGMPSGLDEMQVSNSADFSGATWVDYVAAVADRPLPSATHNGSQTVYVRVRDLAGNVREGQASIVLDTRAPSGTVSIAAGAAAVTSAVGVPLSLNASDDVLKVAFVPSLTADCAAQTYGTDFDANATYTFAGTPPDGTLELTACFQDAAGNIGSASDTVLLDQIEPSVTVLINGATGALNFTNDAAVTLTISASDATSGVAGVRIGNSSALSALSFEALTGNTVAWQLASPTVDEQKIVYVQVRDNAGLVSTVASATVQLDTAPPTGSISVVGGNVVQSASVSLSVTRGDTNTTEMSIGQGYPSCQGAAYVPFNATPPTFTLTGDGAQSIFLCLKDLAGNTAGFTTTVTLDTEAPTGSLLVNAGAAYAISRDVTLNLTASADATQMKATTAATIDCTSATGYGPLDLAAPFQLPNTDDTYVVRVCIRDASGRYALLTDSIVLDRAGPAPIVVNTTPANTGIQINAGAAETSATTVSVVVGASDATAGVAEFKLSDGAGCSGGTWQVFDDGDSDGKVTASYGIEAGDRVSRTVSVTFRDFAGNVSSACSSDSILIDTAGPEAPAVTVQRGAAAVVDGYTNAATVTLTLFAQSAATYQVSRDPADLYYGNTALTPQAMSGTSMDVSFCVQGGTPGSCTALPAGTSEQRWVYARYYDALGNASVIAQASIYVDNVQPAGVGLDVPALGTVTLVEGTYYSRSQILTVAPVVSAEAGLQMRLSTDGAFDSEAWMDYAPTTTVTLAVSNCAASVCTTQVQYRDLAGNTSASASASVVLDTQAPTGPRVVRATDLATSTAYTLEIVPGIVADTHFSHFEISGGASYGTFTPVSVPATTTSFDITLVANSANTLRIRAVDKAGNVSADDFTIVRHDDTPPARPTNLVVEAHDQQLRLRWDPSPSTDVVYYRVYYGTLPQLYTGTTAAEGSSPINVGNNTSFNLTQLPNRSTYYLSVTAVDEVGNESNYATEVEAAASVIAPRLLSQIGGPLSNVWHNPATGYFYLPSDGGIRVVSSAGVDVAFLPDLPDPTQVFFDGSYVFVHSSDPDLGMVSTLEVALFEGLPNPLAPNRTLSVYDAAHDWKKKIELPEGTAFFSMAKDGTARYGVSATSGTTLEVQEGGPPLRVITTTSELSRWSFDSSTGTFSLESSEPVDPVLGWTIVDDRYLVVGTYEVGNFSIWEFVGRTGTLRAFDPFTSMTAPVGIATINPADDGTLLIGDFGRAGGYSFHDLGGTRELPVIDFTTVTTPVAHGGAGGMPASLPATATGGGADWIAIDLSGFGDNAMFLESPALIGHDIAFTSGVNVGEARPIVSYALNLQSGVGTFYFDVAAPFGSLPVSVTAGDTIELEVDSTPTRRSLEVSRMTSIKESGADLVQTAGSSIVTSASAAFQASSVYSGDSFEIMDGPNKGVHTVASVQSETQLTLTVALTSSASGSPYETWGELDELRDIAGDPLAQALFIVGKRSETVVHELSFAPAAATPLTAGPTRTFSRPVSLVRVFPAYVVVVADAAMYILPRATWSTATPVVVSLDNLIHQFVVKDGIIYAAAQLPSGASSFSVIDASDPEAPATVTRVPTTRPVQRFATDGNRLHVLLGECEPCANNRGWCGGDDSTYGNQNCNCAGTSALATYTLSPSDLQSSSGAWPGATPTTPQLTQSVALGAAYVDDIVPFKEQLLAWAHGTGEGAGNSSVLRLVGQERGGSPGVVPGTEVGRFTVPLVLPGDAPPGSTVESFGLATAGPYVFVAGDPVSAGENCGAAELFVGLRAYRMTGASSQVLAGFSDATALSDVRDLQVSGNYLYVFSKRGLSIFDVSGVLSVDSAADYAGAANILELGSWRARRSTGGLVIGPYAYVLTENDVTIVDVTNPTLPREAYVLDIEEPLDIATERGLLYVTSRQEGLRIYELARSSAFRSGARYQDGAVELATAAHGEARFYSSTHDSPAKLYAFTLGTSESHDPGGVQVPMTALRRGVLYAFGDSEVWSSGWDCDGSAQSCLAVTDATWVGPPADGALLDSRTAELGDPFSGAGAWDGAACSSNDDCCNFQYCADTDYDWTPDTCVSRPLSLQQLVRGASTTYFGLLGEDPWRTTNVSPSIGVHVFEHTAPRMAPVSLTSSRLTAGWTSGCSVANPDIGKITHIIWHNGVLYAAGRRLMALNAAHPDHADFLSSAWSTDDGGTMCSAKLAAAGHYLYVLGDSMPGLLDTRCGNFDNDRGYRLWIYDITDPLAPQKITSFQVSERYNSNELVVSGNTVYLLSSYDQRVVFVDVTDRASPVVRGAYSLSGDGRQLDLFGSELYVNTGAGGLVAIDGR